MRRGKAGPRVGSGAIASAVSALVCSLGGWDAVAAIGAAVAALGLLVWLTEHRMLLRVKATPAAA